MSEKSLNQTAIGDAKPNYEEVKSGIKSPFQDAIIKDLPKSGEPTGSVLPKA